MILPALSRLTLSALLGAAALSGAAAAQDCPSEPQFVSQSAGNRDVAASATRVDRGEWRNAEAFGWRAVEGTSEVVAGAAYVNLCAAVANRSQDQLMAICDAGVSMSEVKWAAHTNRGAARWMTGDQDGAAEDFAAAAELAPEEAAVQHNQALAACR
ncbi:MAG: hypothetical protein R3360_03630 [Alphaproteobacteria bacterium]|nr:hypothetical protein [Alphaproteobacteria bacterium]